MTLHLFPATSEFHPAPRAPHIGLDQAYCLQTGSPAFAMTRVDPVFGDVRVGPAIRGSEVAAPMSPTVWLANAITRLSQERRSSLQPVCRPLHLPVPSAALLDPEAAGYARQAADRSGLCPQEVALEIADSSLVMVGETAMDCIDTFRRAGFRIALDCRRSWEFPFCARLRGAVMRLRANAIDLAFDEDLQRRSICIADAEGQVILDRCYWRDVDMLTSVGASHSLRLLADA